MCFWYKSKTPKKKINRTSSDLMDKIIRNWHRKEGWEGIEEGWRVFSFSPLPVFYFIAVWNYSKSFFFNSKYFYVCMYSYIYIYIYTHIYRKNLFLLFIETCWNERMLPNHTHTYTHIYIYIYMHTHTHTHTHIYIYVCVCVCVYVCVCVCVCVVSEKLFSLVGRVSADGPGDLGPISGCHTKVSIGSTWFLLA